MGCPCLKSNKFKPLEDEPVKRKVVMLGLDSAGKTALLTRIQTNQFAYTNPTVGLNLETIKRNKLELLIFDVGGKARHMWSYYLDNLEALIFVIDSCDRTRISVIKEEIIRITDNLKDRNYVMLLFLNKQDLKNKMEAPDIMHQLDIGKIEHIVDIIVQRCSAVTGEGIEEGLQKLAGYFDRKGITFR
jgi:small GTP-binding protein